MPSCISYRWVVVFAALTVRAIVYGITYTSGIVYVIVLRKFQTGKAETSWISSIVTTVMFASGLPLGRLLKSFGWRIIAISGGLIAGVGLFLSSLSTQLTFLILSYGFVTGLGCGMAYMVATVAVPVYFLGHPRQKIAVAVASCGTGVGTFVFSPIIQQLDSAYGSKGLFLVLAGVALQFCTIGLIFRPVSSKNTEKCEKLAASWHFLKNPGFYVTHFGIFLAGFGDSIIYGHLGEYAETLGFSNDKGAYLYSIIGISVMLLKLLQGAALDAKVSMSLPIKLGMIFYLLGGVSTISLLFSDEYYVLVIYSAVFGASTAATGGAIVVGILETYYGHENLELTLGMNLAFFGVGNLLGAPLAGSLFEVQDSYTPVMILVTVTKILSSFLLLLVYIFCPQVPRVLQIKISSPEEEEEKLNKEEFPNIFMENERTPLLNGGKHSDIYNVAKEITESELELDTSS